MSHDHFHSFLRRSHSNRSSVTYTFHSAARCRHLLFAAIGHTGTPRVQPTPPPPSVRPHACGPPPGCSASPGRGIRSESPDEVGSEPETPEAGGPEPGPDTSDRTEEEVFRRVTVLSERLLLHMLPSNACVLQRDWTAAGWAAVTQNRQTCSSDRKLDSEKVYGRQMLKLYLLK